MRFVLILLSFGLLVSAGDDERSLRLSRGVFHGVDLRQILAAVEPAYPQQYVIASQPLQPVVQQFAMPLQVPQQQFIVNLPAAAPVLTQELSLPQGVNTASEEQSYNAPKPQPQYSGPILREELSSVEVASAHAQTQNYQQEQMNSLPSESKPNQHYGSPAAPQRDYGPPQREYGPPQREYSPPQKEYGPPQKEYAPPQNYGPPASQPSADYGPPANKQHIQVSAPEPAQSYGVPNPAVVLSQPQPAQSYGLPAHNNQPNNEYGAPAVNNHQPNNEYGAPAVNNHNFNSNSLNDFAGGNNYVGGGIEDGADITKDISIHIPTPERYEPARRHQQPRILKRKKNYKIIFIKAPAPPPPQVPEIPDIEPEPEQKTLVYVLVQKPEEARPVIIPTPAPAPKSKPEVYFVKYRQAISDDHGSHGEHHGSHLGEENFERGSPLGGDQVGIAPSQEVNLPKHESTHAKSGGYSN